MNTHALLSFVQNNYDFRRADLILSEGNLKKCWKQWLTAELVHLFNGAKHVDNVQTEVHYLDAELKGDNDSVGEQPLQHYLQYHRKTGVNVVMEKRSASRCDFGFRWQGAAQMFEIRCGSSVPSINKKELLKFEEDIDRIDALKLKNPQLSIASIFAFYGIVTNKDAVLFKTIDNSRRCTFVLDSSLEGSSSIARLSQMKRAGEPRLCLAAYSA